MFSIINSALAMLGFQLAPAVQDSSKPVGISYFYIDYLPIFTFYYVPTLKFQFLEPGTEPFTPEQEFGEMTLSDYDSNEDADFEPTYSEESSDDLEYDSDASVSSASEEEESASDV